MKPDYKNWVPKGMVYGLAGGTIAAFAAFLILGATGIILHGTPRLVCGIIFGIGTLVLLFFTVWMGALHKTFDYNGKRKLAKTIIDGTASKPHVVHHSSQRDNRFIEEIYGKHKTPDFSGVFFCVILFVCGFRIEVSFLLIYDMLEKMFLWGVHHPEPGLIRRHLITARSFDRETY